MQTCTSAPFASLIVTGVVALASTLAACSVAASPSSEPTAQASEALAPGGGLGETDGWCDPDTGYCTCTGDDDCNNMFGSGVCGAKAICQINSADVPRCRCVVAAVKPTKPIHGIGIINPAPPVLSQK